MYRKQHRIKEEEMEASSAKSTGIKTIDRLSEIPMVNTALSSVTDYYGKVKEKNCLLRTSFNLAELSVRTMAFAATPITTLCKKPIDSVDSFLCEKVDALEQSYPVISKPTDQLTASAMSEVKGLYDKTITQPIESLHLYKDRTVADIKTYGSNKVIQSADLGVRLVDTVLENRYAKLLADPFLNITEKSLDYLIPTSLPTSSTDGVAIVGANDNNHTTLRRIYDINNRVFTHIYQATFTQLHRIHAEFENTILKLRMVKQTTDNLCAETRERVAQNSLVARCIRIVDANKLSIQHIESLALGYYITILEDVRLMVDKYMNLVKSFPVAFNGTLLRQTIDSFTSQFNKESLSKISSVAIEQIKIIARQLGLYTQQMYQVLNWSFMELLKRIPSQVSTAASKLDQLSKLNWWQVSRTTATAAATSHANTETPSSTSAAARRAITESSAKYYNNNNNNNKNNYNNINNINNTLRQQAPTHETVPSPAEIANQQKETQHDDETVAQNHLLLQKNDQKSKPIYSTEAPPQQQQQQQSMLLKNEQEALHLQMLSEEDEEIEQKRRVDETAQEGPEEDEKAKYEEPSDNNSSQNSSSSSSSSNDSSSVPISDTAASADNASRQQPNASVLKQSVEQLAVEAKAADKREKVAGVNSSENEGENDLPTTSTATSTNQDQENAVADADQEENEEDDDENSDEDDDEEEDGEDNSNQTNDESSVSDQSSFSSDFKNPVNVSHYSSSQENQTLSSVE